jgi:hypothetical protein
MQLYFSRRVVVNPPPEGEGLDPLLELIPEFWAIFGKLSLSVVFTDTPAELCNSLSM